MPLLLTFTPVSEVMSTNIPTTLRKNVNYEISDTVLQDTYSEEGVI